MLIFINTDEVFDVSKRPGDPRFLDLKWERWNSITKFCNLFLMEFFRWCHASTKHLHEDFLSGSKDLVLNIKSSSLNSIKIFQGNQGASKKEKRKKKKEKEKEKRKRKKIKIKKEKRKRKRKRKWAWMRTINQNWVSRWMRTFHLSPEGLSEVIWSLVDWGYLLEEALHTRMPFLSAHYGSEAHQEESDEKFSTLSKASCNNHTPTKEKNKKSDERKVEER